MNENERVKAAEINPYDHLIEPETEPVRSPVILENASEPEMNVRPDRTMELIPLAEAAVYSRLPVKSCKISDVIHMEIEDDILVPDICPDMESILNMDVSVDSTDTYKENDSVEIKGKLKLETTYRSAERYGSNISTVSADIEFEKKINTAGDIYAVTNIEKIEYRIVNERKYKVRISLGICVNVKQDNDYMIFEDIEGEKLYLHKETVSLADLISRKISGSDINEELLINDDKIRPVKILKSKIVAAENHRQLTKEKLILNQTLWIRILYLAEIASKGNLSNQPMLFQGYVDNTQFILPGSSESEAAGCTTYTSADNLKVEINRESNGFDISGEIVTCTDYYKDVKKEIVTDFYHEKEDITYDIRQEKVCTGVSSISAEQTLNESISMQDFSGDELRIIYLDAHVTDPAVSVEGASITVSGKLHLEAAVMNEGDYTMTAKKICDFACVKELAQWSGGRTELSRIFVRKMTGDVTGGKINLTAQIQANVNIYNETELNCISNPCIIRSGQPAKNYPITVHMVAEGESIWEIGKKYKVGEESITAYNKAEDVKPGKKIIIVK